MSLPKPPEMTYKMQPAGHEAPAPRRNYPEPDQKLTKAFEEYLEFASKANVPDLDYYRRHRYDLYEHAERILKGMTVTPYDAHALLLTRDLNESEKNRAGFFLSAVYNNSDAKDIVYDLEISISNLAFRLPWDKAFISTGNGHWYSGTGASGIIVLYVKKGEFKNGINYLSAGLDATGSLITYDAEPVSHYNDYFGDVIDNLSIRVDCLEEPKIDVKDTRYIASACRATAPAIREYEDQLIEKFAQGRNDYRIVLETIRSLGAKPHEKIKKDIADIGRRTGRYV